MKRDYAWHFVGDTLRDGTPIPRRGRWLEWKGDLKLCPSVDDVKAGRGGLHWSREPFDALTYAPGSTLCLVQYRGDIIEQSDKGCGHWRKIIARMQADNLLYFFARQQALSCLDNWQTDPDQCVLDWLMGDETQKSAAESAAWSAWSAARSAAESAAESAAWSARSARSARSAAESAWSAARSARSAAWSAARLYFNELVYECFEGYLK